MRRFALLFALCTMVLGCHKTYDFEQKEVELSTLGNELFKVWRKDAARSAENADAKVAMLDENFAEFVDAVDVMAPEEELPAIDQFVRNMLSLVDDGILPALTRKLFLILDFAAGNDPLLQAFVAPSGPDSETYISDTVAPDFLGFVTGFEDLPGFLELQGRIIGQNDGFDDDGARTFEEPHAISDMLRVLANTLAEESTDPNETPVAAIIRDMLLIENDVYRPMGSIAVPAVMYDDRGYPAAAMADGEVQFPFVDNDGDGQADLDAEGNFIYSNGGEGLLRPFATEQDVNEPVTRDDLGRALTGGPNTFAFTYVDLQNTALGFLLRQFLGLSQKDTLWNMMQAFQVVLGTKVLYTDDIGGYEGYDIDNPLTDFSYAAVNIVDTPGLPDTLEGVAELTERRPAQLAKLFAALEQVVNIMDKYPDAGMTDDQTLVYDMLPYLEEILEDPVMWADVMAGLREPINRRTGEAFATMLEFRDSDSVPVMDGPYDSCFQTCKGNFELGTIDRYECIRACPMDEIFDEKADLNAPETEENRTAFQKFFYLVADTHEAPFEMAIGTATLDGDALPALPPLLYTDSQAAMFLRSAGGYLDFADFVPPEVFQGELGDLLLILGVDNGNVGAMISILSDLFGAHLDQMATPDQLTRLFNLDDIKFETPRVLLDIDDPKCNDGYVPAHHLAYGLFQAEAAGVIDVVHPLAEAFAKNDKEWVMGGLMTVIHEHYSTHSDLYRTAAGAPSPMKGTNMRSLEPAMEDMMLNSDLFDALFEFSNAVEEVEQTTGIPISENLRVLLHNAVKRDGFTNRRGEDFVLINDGRTVSNPSRLHFLLDAIDDASERLDAEPEKREKLSDAVGNMFDVMLAAEISDTGNGAFKNPGSAQLTIDATRYLAERAREKQANNELSPWLQDTLLTEAEDIWSSRLLAALVDLAGNILSNDADRATIDAFMAYQLGTSDGQAQTLVAVYQLLVKSVDKSRWLPIAKFLADVVNPDRIWESEPYRDVPIVSLGAQLLAKTLELDPNNDGIFLIHRGLKRPPFGDSPFTVILDLIARYFSPDPSQEAFETTDDYRHFMQRMSEYLNDDVHGMERLYEVVDQRLRE